MTKLEFIDKINDILIGLNTAESDALGSLYDELMRDAGWHPASVPPVVPEHYNWISVVAIVLDMDDNSTRATNATFNKDKGWIFPEFSRVLYWCYRPKED